MLDEDNIKENYSKEKLLAYLGQADDAMIRTHDDKYLIIYNPKSGNQDNYDMWGDYSVFAVDQDGEEHEVLYSDIDDFQLEGLKEEKIEIDADTEFVLPLKHLIQKHVKEILTKKSSIKKHIEDFKDSDAPQFKGKSQEKRRKMAVASYLSKK
jgi:hypothetical protein